MQASLFFISSLITLTDCSSLFLEVYDLGIFGLALVLDVLPPPCCLSERGQVKSQLHNIMNLPNMCEECSVLPNES